MLTEIMTRLIFIFFTILVSCGQTAKFNQDDWQNTSDLGRHPLREKMLKDLTENHKLKGLHYADLIKKLGQPDFWEPENSAIYYGLAINYAADLDPTGQRVLQFKFSSDSIITNFLILDATQ